MELHAQQSQGRTTPHHCKTFAEKDTPKSRPCLPWECWTAASVLRSFCSVQAMAAGWVVEAYGFWGPCHWLVQTLGRGSRLEGKQMSVEAIVMQLLKRSCKLHSLRSVL